MTFCCFNLYLENETLYEFHVMDFLTPYDPRKSLIYITNKLPSTNLDDGWSLAPCNDPRAADFE